MKFSEHFGLTVQRDDDWLNLIVEADTPLYIDPFLIYDDPDPFWSSAHDDVTKFFVAAMELVREANGNRRSASWKKALAFLHFPEPKEFALGLAMGHPEGSGTGEKMAELMAEALDIISKADVQQVEYVDAFTLFCDGLGLDRISDAFCNIIKGRFIDYTQQVVERHGIPTSEVRVKHLSWSGRFTRWNDGRIELPESPAFDGGILLTPKRFVKDIPRVTTHGFFHWAEANAADDLRRDMNYDLSKGFTRRERSRRARETARRRPDLAFKYLQTEAEKPHEPYDVDADPELFSGWQEAGQKAASALPQPIQPTPEDFNDWSMGLVNEFKHAVEEQDLWRALWDDKFYKHRKEKIAQSIASAMFGQRCRMANVDLSRENDIGRGPVDFKFSAGWERRVLIEAKNVDSTGFFKGASKQLPQYLKSEAVSYGIYLVVAYSDKDMDEGKDGRLTRVRETVAALAKQKGIKVDLVVVDARPKVSASKIREGGATEELDEAEELDEPDDGEASEDDDA